MIDDFWREVVIAFDDTRLFGSGQQRTIPCGPDPVAIPLLRARSLRTMTHGSRTGQSFITRVMRPASLVPANGPKAQAADARSLSLPIRRFEKLVVSPVEPSAA
jgi:hypothetical protein